MSRCRPDAQRAAGPPARWPSRSGYACRVGGGQRSRGRRCFDSRAAEGGTEGGRRGIGICEAAPHRHWRAPPATARRPSRQYSGGGDGGAPPHAESTPLRVGCQHGRSGHAAGSHRIRVACFSPHPAAVSHALPRPAFRAPAGQHSRRVYGGGRLGNVVHGVGSERLERRSALDDAVGCSTAQWRAGVSHRESVRRADEARQAGAGRHRPWRRHRSRWPDRGGDELLPVRRFPPTATGPRPMGPVGRDAIMAAQGAHFDLLLGRRTCDLCSGFWPKAPTSPMADRLHAAIDHIATHCPDS